MSRSVPGGAEGAPTGSAVVRVHEGFELAREELVLFALKPGPADYVSAAAMGGVVWAGILVGGAGSAPAAVLATLVALLAIGVAALFLQTECVLVATDRGLRIRTGNRRELIPWSDIVSISSITPGIAQWEIRVRSDVADGASPYRDPPTRKIGTYALWDLTGRRAASMRELMDQCAINEIRQASESSVAPPSVATPASCSPPAQTADSTGGPGPKSELANLHDNDS